ncbi:MAG: hypothetical protein NZM37_12310 [Sandaracinaceae bacterium]|nr:hypothetical protein [Sandaracinaceae bacterium]
MHCQGFYPEAPQHILKVGKTIPFLRIVVDNPSHDLTLLVRTPEGQWVCNDDSQDPSTPFNPLIDLTNLRGEVEIYVGTFERDGVGASYTLGITEDPGYYGSSLRGD